MQDLNEDLDDQFRKAVDHYRVRPPESKWDELSGKIVSIKRPRSLADRIRSKYMKWFMLLGLIILIPVVIVSIVPGINGYQGIKTGAADIAIQKNKTEIIYQKSKKERDLVSQVREASVKQNKTESIGGPVSLSGEPDKIASTVNTVPFVKEPDKNTSIGISISAKNGLNETVIVGNSVPDKNDMNSPENRSNDLKVIGIGSAVYSEQDFNNKPLDLTSPYGLTLTQSYPKNIEPPFGKNEPSPLALNSGNHENLPLKHLDYPRRQGIYLGLVGGPMLTQVGDQGLKKSGFDFGLIAGYTFNKKFSIETGLIYTNQYYFVSGEYYNKFARVTTVTSLEGSRNAFEIPLTLKYNDIRKERWRFLYCSRCFNLYRRKR